MTSGRKAEQITGVFVSALCACLLVVCAPRSAHAASTGEVDLAELMQKLSEVRSAQGSFTERKYLSILSEPLILEGRVRYRAPDYVRKEYDGPESESYEVRGDHLTIEYPDGRRRELSVDEHPVLRAFVESYRGTLAGDLETLQRYFDLQLDGRMDDWILHLIPRQEDLAAYLSEVVMLGRDSIIYSVETLEASGDRSVMTVDTRGE
jgi:outer membrane lipoprotein-sorting protein